MNKKRFDHHIHSSFSYDAGPDCTIGAIIEAALAKGLDGIAVTDHLDPLWPDDSDPSWLDVPAYEKGLDEAEATNAANAGRLLFSKGIELGFIPGEALEICEEAVSAYPYDFVLGSVHSSATTPIELPPFVEGRGLRDIIDEYYRILLDSIRVYKNFDVLGHINGIDRYTDGFADESLYMPYADEILRILVAGGKGLEVNMSSIRYNIAERGTPTLAILRRFKELGGEIVTLGSDAHSLAGVGEGLEQGEELIRAAGFRHIAFFTQRRPEFYAL